MKSKTHGKSVKTFSIYKSAAALLLLAVLAVTLAVLSPAGGDIVHAFTQGERITDLEFDLHNNNSSAGGIAAEGRYLYAADRTGDKMYAYRKSPTDLSTHGDHSSSLDFDLHSSNQDPWGVWNYQSHLYVLDDEDRQVYVYRLDEYNSNNHGDRVSSKEFTLDSSNADGRGIWSNGTTVWVADQDDDKLYAYTLSNGNRDSGKDIDLLGNNDDPSAIWSDLTTVWVLDWVDLHVYAYDLSDGTARTGREFALHSDNTLPRGFWGDGSTLWVSDHGMDKVFAYDVDRANQYLHLNSDVNEEHVRGVAGTGDRFFLSNSFDPDTVQVFDRSDNSYESGETFETHANNNAVRGLWTDGTHIWVIQSGSSTLYAYQVSDGSYVSTSSLTLDSANENPLDIWGTDDRFFVLDVDDDHVYAYNRSTSMHVAGEGFDLHADNDDPTGIASDGSTLWVTDDDDLRMYAYRLTGSQKGERRTDKEFNLHRFNNDPGGAWFGGKYIHVIETDNQYAPLHRYDVEDLFDPVVTLVLSDRAVSENGDTVTVTATLDKESSQATTITVSESSDAVNLTGSATLTIAANSTTTTDTATLTGADDDVFTGNRFVAISGTAVNTAGVTGPADVRLVVRDDETVPLETYSYDSALDFYGLDTATNNIPYGVWSDGTTMWVVDTEDHKLYAYRMNPGQADHGNRDSAKEFDLDARNTHPNDIWSDGVTIWVADSSDNKLYAYRMNPGEADHGSREPGKDIALHSDNSLNYGLWSDGVTVWVADDGTNEKMFAYKMNPGGTGHGDRESAKEFNLDAGNSDPFSIWSDGETIWVADGTADKLFAYTLSGGSRVAGKDLALGGENANLSGIFADGTTLWVADHEDDNIYAYSLMPRVTLELSDRAVSENGGTATVTATLDRASAQQTTITVSEDSDAVTLTGSTLTIAANSTTSSGSVVLTGVDDDVFTGSRFVPVSGSAVNTDGVTGPADVRLVVRDDETVPLETYSYNSALDFTDLANQLHYGAWSDGTTMYMTGHRSRRFFAYNMNPGEADHGDRDRAKEFPAHSGYVLSYSIWSDGTTLWATEFNNPKIRAYKFNPGAADHGDRDWRHDINLHMENGSASGIWSDGVTVWVADLIDDKIYAYRMNPGQSDHGERDAAKDFNLHGDNNDAKDLWSDGTTLWVTDDVNDKVYAYSLSGGIRDTSKEFALARGNDNQTGIFSDGTALWVVDPQDRKIYAYSLLPKVTLKLSDRAVSENGGTATVTATLDMESTHETTITVSEDSEAATLTGTTLTIAAGQTATTDTVTLTGVDDDVFTGNRFVAVSGTAVNTAGVTQPTDVRLVVRDDETVPVQDMVRNSALDFNGLDAATNDSPWGTWSDGTTMWVADYVDDKLYAYTMNPGQADHGNRDTAKEFNLDGGNTQPTDIWSDGVTIWVANDNPNKVFAYRMNPGETDHGSRESGKDIALHSENADAYGLWSDGVTVWVANDNPNKVFAYKMNPGGTGHGERETGKEFNLAAGNGDTWSIWSDGETGWVVDGTADKLFAYTLSGGTRDTAKEFTLPSGNGNPRGAFVDGTTLWVAESEMNPKLFAYSLLPTVTLAVSPTVISENGGTATVTATLDMESTHETTITVSESSSDLTQAGTTLTIAAGQTASSGSVVLTGVNNTDEDGSRQATISGSAANNYGILGPADVTLTVTDDDRPNNAPVVSNPVGDRTADVGRLFSIDVSRIFTDPDNDPLTFSVTLGGGLDQWLEYDTANLILSGTPGSDHLGRGQVSITATDVGSATATHTFRVTVVESNFDAVTLVSNLGQAPCANGRSVCDLNPQVGYVIPAGTQRAVEFTTGRQGATLNQVVANFQNRRRWEGNGPEPTAFSAPTLELWSHHVEVVNAQLGLTQTSPGELLATFASSRLPDVGNFEYRLTDPYQLQENTTYWLVFGCDDYCPFPVSRTTSDREDRGGMSGWTIANDGRLRSGADRGWGSPSTVIKVRLDRFEYLSPVLVPYHGDTLEHRPGIDPLTNFVGIPNGNDTVRMQFNQSLDTSSVPATSDFILRYRGPQPPAACGCSDSVNDVSISSVRVSGDEVRLNLNRKVAYYGLFSLEYRPGTNPLRSADRQINAARFYEPYVGWRRRESTVKFVNPTREFDEDDGRQSIALERRNGKDMPFGVETHVLLSVQDADSNPLPPSNDFVSLSRELVTLPAFADTVEVPVTIRDNSVVETKPQRISFVLEPSPRNDNLSGLRGTNGIRVNARWVVTINDDDDTQVKVANAVAKTVNGQTRYVASYTAREGQEIEIPLILDPKLVAVPITASLAMDGDSTAGGDDFDWKGRSAGDTNVPVRFDPLTRRAAATLQVLADTDDGEGDETLLFRLDGSGLAIVSLSAADNHYVEVTIRDLPAAPANLTASAGTDRITLNWDAVTGATRYNVLRRTADQTTFSRLASPTTNTYVDRGARVDVTYHYQVQATNTVGTSPSSGEASAVILPPLPPAPTGFKATVEEGPQVALNWNAVSDRYLTGYRVSRGGTELALLDTRTRKYTDTGVSVGTTYEYTVVGVNSAGDGPSATVSIEVTSIVDGVRTPGNLRAEAEPDSITLHWDEVDNAMRYRVHRKGPGETAHEYYMSTNATSLWDNRVTHGGTYSYKVQAQDWDFNKGALSDAVEATVPHPIYPPRNLTAELDASNSKTVNLAWDAPTPGAFTLTGYKLFRSKHLHENTLIATLGDGATSYQDIGTSWDQSHDYNLIATYSGNRESEPARVNIRIPSQPPS